MSLCPESCLPARKDCLTRLPSTVLGGQDSFLCPLMSRGYSFLPSLTSWNVYVSCGPHIPCLCACWAFSPRCHLLFFSLPLSQSCPSPHLIAFKWSSRTSRQESCLCLLCAWRTMSTLAFSILCVCVCVCVCVCLYLCLCLCLCLSVCLFSHPGW